MIISAIIIGIILILLFSVMGIYNRLVTLNNRVKNAWGQIDVQLQRRYDLIPNLVETVKGYMEFEKSTLEAVINARTRGMAAREEIQKTGGTPTDASIKEIVGAEATLSGGLGKIFALAENYPQLRSTENMQQLQEELRSTENKVAFSRQSYNDQVMLYNTAQEQFPTVIFASMFGHKPAALFQIESEEAKKSVKVAFTHQ